jgi:NADH:ubiquinone oxidoreductase subunit F (NADH-binding)/NADH:ubiquinone oxidoreductase subunit E/Pyruvate/2-oxoacid:ferredoxin oxidoreductase delta subunit
MPAAAQTVREILTRYPRDESSLIMVLQDVQDVLNYLPEDAINAVAEGMGLPRSRVYSVASFYKAFSLTPRGRHQVDVCMGTACHVRGAGRLVNQLSEELGVPPGGTTEDLEFSLNTVNCVGACALGPVLLADGEMHGEMTPRKVTRAVDRCRSGEAAGAGKHSCRCAAEKTGFGAEPVVRLPSPAALDELRAQIVADQAAVKTTLSICAGTGCLAKGSLAVAGALETATGEKGLDVEFNLRLKKTGCHGFCEKGPLVVIEPAGIFYTNVKTADVDEIVEKTLLGGEVVERLLYRDPITKERAETYTDIPFYARQQRIALRNIGRVDPSRIEDYIAAGGYRGLAAALSGRTPEEVIDEIDRSGLRGRGGGGFPTGKKWRTCRNAGEGVKYVLCNADEGDPGAFMDRSICEGDPHAVLEGMAIGAYAVGAGEGYIYVRKEYPLAVEHLSRAIEEAKKRGLLGDNILGTGFSYDVKITRGGGAFVCGESSALMQSIAGKVGEPRAKYVHSVLKGLYEKPTVLNNVETWANVPWIMTEGSGKFAALGTERSKGTKAFSLVGKVKNTGLVEVPMGITLREIIFEIGGGIIKDRPFKGVQTGGPSGGCLPESKLDIPVDFDTLTAAGSMMGSGGMIVMDDQTCMVDVARYFIDFLNEESCGKCAACRLGLAAMKEILDRICAGEGRDDDIATMEKLFAVLDDGALCGLGNSAANPVRSTLAFFRDEYEAHIRDKRCPAGVCRALITYSIDEESCTGCGLCLKSCPRDAIAGEKKGLHVIDEKKCDRCGICVASCKFDSVLAK